MVKACERLWQPRQVIGRSAGFAAAAAGKRAVLQEFQLPVQSGKLSTDKSLNIKALASAKDGSAL